MPREFVVCKVCGQERREYAGGVCSGCYRRERSKVDPEYAARVKEIRKKRRQKKRAENPHYDPIPTEASEVKYKRLYEDLMAKLQPILDDWAVGETLEGLVETLQGCEEDRRRLTRIIERYYALAIRTGNGELPADYSIK